MLIEAGELRKRLIKKQDEEAGLVMMGLDYAIDILNMYEGEVMEEDRHISFVKSLCQKKEQDNVKDM